MNVTVIDAEIEMTVTITVIEIESGTVSVSEDLEARNPDLVHQTTTLVLATCVPRRGIALVPARLTGTVNDTTGAGLPPQMRRRGNGLAKVQ